MTTTEERCRVVVPVAGECVEDREDQEHRGCDEGVNEDAGDSGGQVESHSDERAGAFAGEVGVVYFLLGGCRAR